MTVIFKRPPVRKALSIAVRYSWLKIYDPKLELVGAHKDPYILRKLLVDLFRYDSQDITILMDDENGEHIPPTRENIIKAMHDLVDDARDGDHYVFHFSGHGSQIPNENGTEKDGKDEVIWPFDIKYNGGETCDDYIMDDEIHDILIERIPPGAHFMMVFDCCHSGTAADLPNNSDDDLLLTPPSSTSSGTFPAESIKNLRIQGTETVVDESGGHQRQTVKHHFPVPSVADVTSWSACEDDQETFDAPTGGLFVTVFDRVLRTNPHATHHEVLHSVTREIAKIVKKANERRPIYEEPYRTPSPELGALETLDKVFDKHVIDDD